MHEKFGFRTRRFSILKAYEEDAAAISKLYTVPFPKMRTTTESNWKEELKRMENDFYKDVIFLLRDRAKKVLGVVNTMSKDGCTVEIGIWIPNKFKRELYLDELVDSMIEWSEADEYDKISSIQVALGINPSGANTVEVRNNIALQSA